MSERLMAAADGLDLSTLVALRALVDCCNGEGALDRAQWLTALREQYHRWYARRHGPGAEPQNFPASETVRYLDEHVVRALEGAGVVEPLPHAADDPDPAAGDVPWAAVRLTPWAAAAVGADRPRILQQLDGRIGTILDESTTTDAPAPEAAPRPRRAPVVVPGGATLRARGLVKIYRKRRVVNEVDLHVSQGEIVGLLGPNGAGKTTSFYMMVGLIRPDKGSVHIGERELTKVPMYRRARAGIGYLAQEPSIFRKLTVEENVMAILQMLKVPKAERKRRLETLLDELSIKHVRKSKAYALSGGERRRLEITRALVGEPKFMLLDEPFAGVDPIAVHDIQQIVSDLRRRGIGVLISDHNVEQTLDIVDRAYIMYDGRVRVSGTVSELVWNEEVAELYLGPTLAARMRERYPNPAEEHDGGFGGFGDGTGDPVDRVDPGDADEDIGTSDLRPTDDPIDAALDGPELAWARPEVRIETEDEGGQAGGRAAAAPDEDRDGGGGSAPPDDERLSGTPRGGARNPEQDEAV